ncbi:DUF1295 domain-containing protein [Croceicoccus estronivorus]|uniref:DUF1295 domain-containing protein n=1 Tax=Croceicoccus estronivorus TaxID=1172626 RepID=UPI000A91A3C0|nr:DUF1295 domain-containing protein [Croceicoccus estronivorus]
MFAQTLMATAAVWGAMAAWMGCAWWFQRRSGNAGWVDVFWTFGTGFTCAATIVWLHGPANPFRLILVAALAALWSVRLGTYLAYRVTGSPEDLRYGELREQWGDSFQPRLFRFVMWQPPVSALLAASALAAAHAPGALNLRDFAGLLILGVAIVGEAIADEQMRRYKAWPDRPPVMDRGLWGRSRHPNYFFEWLAWLAYPVIGFSFSAPASWLTLLAPIVMYCVLRFGTGVPMLEKSMLERKGAVFRNYQNSVNAFFPSLLPPAPSRNEMYR